MAALMQQQLHLRVAEQILKSLATQMATCKGAFFMDCHNSMVVIHRVTQFWLGEGDRYGVTFRTSSDDATIYIDKGNITQFTIKPEVLE